MKTVEKKVKGTQITFNDSSVVMPFSLIHKTNLFQILKTQFSGSSHGFTY